jgi:uncharacterized repeat protein (TIGR01451 family)
MRREVRPRSQGLVLSGSAAGWGWIRRLTLQPIIAAIGGFLLANFATAQVPVITVQPQSATNVANTTVIFTVTATGSSLRYQWYFNRTNVLITSGATTATLTYTNVLKTHQGIYTVVVSNNSGSVTSAPATLVVIDPPEVTRQPTDVTVAVGGSATFSLSAIGDPPLTYQWFFNVIYPIQGATNTVLTLTNLQPSDSGTYQAEITNPADTVNTHEAVLQVKFPPAIAAPPASLVVTQGNTATFDVTVSGDPPFTYQWFFNGTNALVDATNSSLVLPDAQPAQAGNYRVSVAGDVGVVTSAVATLVVLVPPAIVQQPANLTVSAGASATFTASATGSAPLGYQWFFNGTNALAGATGAILTLPSVQAADAGAYSVLVANAAGTATSAAATLTVRMPPVVTSQPVDVAVFQGQPATFAVVASGSPVLTYQWFFNGTNRLTGATAPSFTLPSAQLANVGSYSVVITNQAGATTSQLATLTVKTPPVIVQHPANRSAVLGGTATFSVTAQGAAPLTYQWFLNVTNAISDATNATLVLSNVQSANVGSYSVRVANPAGSVTSLGATLTIRLPPVISQQPVSLTITQGNSATFTVVVTGDGPFGYRWLFNETNILTAPDSPTLSVLNAQAANAGLYSVLVTNDAASTLSSNATLTVRVPPTITLQPTDTAAAPGGSATFSVTAAGDSPLSYRWFFENTNAIPDATNSTLTLLNVVPPNDGRYSVRISNPIGSVTSSNALLRVRNPPTIAQAPSSMTVTQGQTAVFTVQAGGDGPFTYQWFFNTTNPVPNARSSTLTLSNVAPAAAGAYSVRVTNLVGFVVSPEAILNVRLIPTITRQPASLTLAVGATAAFSVDVTGETPFTYQWRRNVTNLIAAATNGTLLLTNVQLSDTASYSVLVSNQVGFVASDGAALTVLRPPSIVQQPVGVVSTQGMSATFAVQVDGDGPFAYRWFHHGTNPLIQGSNATLVLSNLQPADAGEYSVQASNIVASVRSAPAVLTLRLLPLITQQPTSLTATQGQSAAFSVGATSDVPLAYQWRRNAATLAQAFQSSLSLSNVQPANGGNYDVVVMNQYGSVTSTVAILTVFGIDFGDAPEPAYATLLASDGARHVVVPGVFLGSGVDAEPDGQPTASANGDDLGGSNDETGIRFLSPLRIGRTVSLEVVASTNGLLNAWIDFNGAGGWSQVGEQVFSNQALQPGTNLLSFIVPLDAVIGSTFGRFRFSTSPSSTFSVPGSAFLGLAPDGEVEDYLLTITRVADLEIAQSANVSSVAVGSNATFTILATNRGPSTASGVTVTAQLSSRSTFVSATPSQGACTNLGGLVTCVIGSLAGGGGAGIELVAQIGQGTNTTLAAVTGNEFDPNPVNSSAARSVVGIRLTPQFANSELILLPFPDTGAAAPYPSPIMVSGLTNAVNKVIVTLRQVNHEFPDDIDVLLVGPRGQGVLLMSDCGADQPLLDAIITLDDDAATALPDGAPGILEGTYRPANYGAGGDPFPAPAPVGLFPSNLAAFRGTDPNGVWSLYVVDDTLGNGGGPGFIADGWTLSIVTDEPIADLNLVGNAPAAVPFGTNLIYTIAVTNRGPATSAALFSDTLPPNVSFVSAVPTQGNCTNVAGVVTCDFGDLPVAGSAGLVLTVAPGAGGLLTNTFAIAGSQFDPNPTNNSVTIVTTVLPIARLGLAMSGPPSPLLLNQTANYLLTVTNRGPNTGTSVALTNVLPQGMTFVSAVPSQGGCTNSVGIVRCNFGSLAFGATATLQLAGLPTLVGVNSNFSSVAAAELGSDPAFTAAFHLVTVNPAADLALSAAPPSVNVLSGQDYVTILTVSNRGPSSADATLVDTLPLGVSFVSATSARGACAHANGVVQCQFSNLVVNESASVILAMRPLSLGNLVNTAQVTASVTDFNLANNAVTNFASVVAAADLALAMTDRPDPVWVGEDLVYALTVTNQGPSAAPGVTLTNFLPPGVSFVSAFPSQGLCARTGSEVACNLGPLSVGAGASITVLVHPASAGSLTNTARVSSQVADTSLANNTAVQSTRVIVASGNFVNAAPINIPQLGTASPFPSTILVSGLTASVFRVRVTLNNLTHTYPDDLDLLLVAPDKRAAILMSDCGGEFAVNNISLLLDDDASAVLPDSTPMGGGTFRPANYGTDPDPFTALAPLPPYGTNLATFTGSDPNGIWSLFIVDDADKDSGLLAGGWSLTFSTLDPLADLAVGQAISANPAAVGSNIVFTYSVTNRGPAATSNVRLTNNLPPFLASRNVVASQGGCNFNGDSLNCALGSLSPGAVATVVVSVTSLVTGTGTNAVVVSGDATDLRPLNNTSSVVIVFDLPPVITLQPVSRTVPAGSNVQFTSIAVGAAPLQYQWFFTAAGQSAVPLAGETGSTLTLNNVQPAHVGTYSVRVSNTVGSVLSDPAILAISGPPVVSTISNVVIDEDTPTGLLPFVVQDFDTPLDTLTLLGESSNPGLVPPANIIFGGAGSNRNVRVTPATDQFGDALIGVIVRDTTGAATTNRFTLTVRPVVDLIQILAQPRSLTVVTGVTANLSVSAVSTMPLNYQWQRNGANLAGANGPSLSIAHVQLTNAGTYQVVISNADTNAVSAAAQLQVVEQAPAPTIVSITQAGSAVTISFTTALGASYTLEYKNSFSDSVWTTVSSAAGTGETMSAIDSAATASTRFYRVRVN